jgi:hypothetical protein
MVGLVDVGVKDVMEVIAALGQSDLDGPGCSVTSGLSSRNPFFGSRRQFPVDHDDSVVVVVSL